MINNYLGGGYKTRYSNPMMVLGYHDVSKSDFLKTLDILEGHIKGVGERKILGYSQARQIFKEDAKHNMTRESLVLEPSPHLVWVKYLLPKMHEGNSHMQSIIRVVYSENLDSATMWCRDAEINRNEDIPKDKPNYLIINSNNLEILIKAIMETKEHFALDKEKILCIYTDSFVGELAGESQTSCGMTLKQMIEQDYPNRMPTLKDVMNDLAEATSSMRRVREAVDKATQPPITGLN